MGTRREARGYWTACCPIYPEPHWLKEKENAKLLSFSLTLRCPSDSAIGHADNGAGVCLLMGYNGSKLTGERGEEGLSSSPPAKSLSV